MVKLGFTLSSEEFGPRDLAAIAARAEEAGFEHALISDHFHPWIDEQGHSPFVWTVLGAAAQATERLRIGTGVTCPILRIHPAIIAHAAATAAALMPGRFFLGVGTGEFLNEHITGSRWPAYKVRLDMLKEAVSIIRQLWEGELFTFHGKYFTVENARIYTRPDSPPPVYVAASGPKSTFAAAEIGDGLIGTSADESMVRQFTESGGRGKPRYGQITVCWADDEKKAQDTLIRVWPIPAIPGNVQSDLALPSQFDALAKALPKRQLVKSVVCGPDPQKHVDVIESYAKAGFDHIYIHQVGPDQEGCIRFYEKEILPRYRVPLAA